METDGLTRTLKAQLISKTTLIAHVSEDDKDSFLEIRNINDCGNMAEGRPITQEFMNEPVGGYLGRHSSTPYGKVPSNLIYYDSRKGSERYVWYSPPHKRVVFFSSDLKIENAEYNLPGVTHEAGEHGMRIHAYKDDVPGKDTLPYVAPFFSMTDSSVCLGFANVDLPENLTYGSLLQYWEKRFWLTEFLRLGDNGNPTRSNLVLVMKAARNKPFDLRELKPLNNIKLKDILT